MALTDLMASDVRRLIATDDGAVAIVYEEPDSTRTTITANVWDALTEQRDVRGIVTFVTIRNVTFAASEVSAINLRSSVWIADTEYSIARILYQDDYFISLELQRHDLHEHTRPGYRRQ